MRKEPQSRWNAALIYINKLYFRLHPDILTTPHTVSNSYDLDGIYVVEKGGTAEMKKETYSNKSELEKVVKEYEEKGFKVYYNV